MSSKNDLQEYYQARKWGTPYYYTECVGITNNKPQFTCILRCPNIRDAILSGVHNSKKDAEKDVAIQALNLYKINIQMSKSQVLQMNLYNLIN